LAFAESGGGLFGSGAPSAAAQAAAAIV